ncbi:AAA family ATPase [Archangium primigenium]|uniref:AAA family ATPase n=1 Tax=[Archangium] primigenium TaxID=2792470 RepID=UPI00195CDDB8|nr:AAA family ATPase [Archangium primigenium]MBM7119116.1 AAA family ATPase [Archangium primigenium]
MKILAIRGANLTSLTAFKLELDQPPLSAMGLFAITGATGAGKSTVLDAMCLALFDRTPRLGEGRGVPVGRAEEDEDARLRSHDVRGLLRRGTAEGFAEVDFLGRDGRKYRARWSVRRARNRAEGRLQDQEMQLTELTSEGVGPPIGRKKGEVLKAIEERLGLSFDQFRRSALLAQGEFAAFLRAKDEERAELLERMTGTEVYSRMSIAAHQRHRQAQEELAKLDQGVAAIQLLSEGERQALTDGLVGEERALAEAQASRTRAEGAVRWHEARAKHLAEEQDAEQARTRAEEALRAAEPRRQEWERVRAAEALRAPVSGVDAAAHERARTEAEATSRRAEEESARTGVHEREAAREAAEARREAAVRADAEARPTLVAAETLDTALQHVQEQAREATRKWEEARKLEAAAQGVLTALAEQETAALKRVEEIQLWRDKCKPVEAVAREWPRWEEELKRYQAVVEREAAVRPSLEDRRSRAEPLRLEAHRHEVAHREAAARWREAEARVVQTESEQGQDLGPERRRQREALRTRREVLKELDVARRAAREALDEAAQATRDVEEARTARATAEAEAVAARARCTEGELFLKEARRAFERARDAQGLTARRADLCDGEPCPLCGATEHPYRRAGAALEGLVEEGRARVAELEAGLQEATRAESAASAQAESAGQSLSRAEARRDAATKRGGVQREAWSQSRARLTEPRPPESVEAPDAERWLVDALEAARTRDEALRVEEEAAEQRAVKARAARKARDEARVAADAAEGAWRQADEASRRNAEEETRGQEEVERLSLSRRELQTALAVAFKDWPQWESDLSTNAGAFHTRCKKAVTNWNDKEKLLRQEEGTVRELAEKRAPAAATVELRQGQTEACARERTRVEAERDKTRAERAALCNGRPTAEVRAELERTLGVATREAEARKDDAAKAAQVLAVASTRTESASTAVVTATQAHERAESQLGALLAERGLSLAAVRGLLARDAAWCQSEERALNALTQELARCGSVWDERRARRERHEGTDVPALARDEASAALERARQEADARLRAAEGSRARLTLDDQARAKQGEQARLRAQRERDSEVWRTLSELIGSHDGKKFKVFAQSLTLDALLHYANAHLRELAPRYGLMRVPGHDLDLQVVDRDMGDEVRAVSSLSGGESFLVSLALALGLASLSSETTQVDTLFIDEGFGTLDPQTLEMALATLDALQATGRQVGIISHVSGLAERIGAQVRVVKQGAGRSLLKVVGDGGAFSELPATRRPSASVA